MYVCVRMYVYVYMRVRVLCMHACVCTLHLASETKCMVKTASCVGSFVLDRMQDMNIL